MMLQRIEFFKRLATVAVVGVLLNTVRSYADDTPVYKQHASDYGIDPDRLGLMGASAGGHLASLVAVTADRPGQAGSTTGLQQSSRVAALGVFFPPTDLVEYGGRRLDPRADDLLGPIVRRLAFPEGVEGLSEGRIERKLTEISPARLVTSRAPPTLLIHGDADILVPLEQSKKFLAALQQAGVPAELIVKPGGGHPWLTIDQEVGRLSDWFEQQLAHPTQAHRPRPTNRKGRAARSE